jgi:hypothetical protein
LKPKNAKKKQAVKEKTRSQKRDETTERCEKNKRNVSGRVINFLQLEFNRQGRGRGFRAR